MEKDSKSFVVFFDWYENTAELDNSQFGELFRALFKYVESGTIPNFENGAMNMAFRFIKQDIDRNQNKYLEIKKKRSEAGKKHKGNQYTRLEQMEQMEHNVNVNDNVNDNVNVNDNDKEKEKEKELSSSSYFLDCYNETSKPYGEIELSESQSKKIAKRSETEINTFFDEVEKSEWLKTQPFGKVLNLFDNVVSGEYRGKTESVKRVPTEEEVMKIIYG